MAGRGRRPARAVAHDGRNSPDVGDADEVQNLDVGAEVLDRGGGEIAQDRPFALRPDDLPFGVHAIGRQGDQGLPGQMTDQLTAVETADDDEADERIAEDVGDKALDPEILGVKRSGDSDCLRFGRRDRANEIIAVQSADRDGRMVAKDLIGARQGRPSRPGLDSLGRADVDGATTGRAERVERKGGITFIAAEALVALRRDATASERDRFR